MRNRIQPIKQIVDSKYQKKGDKKMTFKKMQDRLRCQNLKNKTQSNDNLKYRKWGERDGTTSRACVSCSPPRFNLYYPIWFSDSSQE